MHTYIHTPTYTFVSTYIHAFTHMCAYIPPAYTYAYPMHSHL